MKSISFHFGFLAAAFCLATWVGFNFSTDKNLIQAKGGQSDLASSKQSPGVQPNSDQPKNQDDSHQEKSPPEDSSQEDENYQVKPAASFSHQGLKTDCQVCHRVSKGQTLQKSPHFIELGIELGQDDQAKIDKAFLGIVASDLQPALRSHMKLEKSQGAIVESVVDESPAYHCGIELHDILIAVDNEPIAGEKRAARNREIQDARHESRNRIHSPRKKRKLSCRARQAANCPYSPFVSN